MAAAALASSSLASPLPAACVPGRGTSSRHSRSRPAGAVANRGPHTPSAFCLPFAPLSTPGRRHGRYSYCLWTGRFRHPPSVFPAPASPRLVPVGFRRAPGPRPDFASLMSPHTCYRPFRGRTLGKWPLPTGHGARLTLVASCGCARWVRPRPGPAARNSHATPEAGPTPRRARLRASQSRFHRRFGHSANALDRPTHEGASLCQRLINGLFP